MNLTLDQSKLLNALLAVANLIVYLYVSNIGPSKAPNPLVGWGDPIAFLVITLPCVGATAAAFFLTFFGPFFRNPSLRTAAAIVGAFLWSLFALLLLHLSHESGSLQTHRLLGGLWLLASAGAFIYVHLKTRPCRSSRV